MFNGTRRSDVVQQASPRSAVIEPELVCTLLPDSRPGARLIAAAFNRDQGGKNVTRADTAQCYISLTTTMEENDVELTF